MVFLIAAPSLASGLWTWLGLPMMALGIALRGAAIRAFGASFTSEIVAGPGHTLVTHGVYARMRHPSDVGLLLIALGLATLTPPTAADRLSRSAHVLAVFSHATGGRPATRGTYERARVSQHRCAMHHLRRIRRSATRGYSLLEILVVLAIIALLSSVIGVAVYQHLLKARVEATRQSALKIRQTVVLYKMNHADECPSVEELRHADEIDAASKSTDAWDQPFLVKCGEHGEIHVASAGPDKKHGTEDDIVAPEPPKTIAAHRE